MSALAGIFKFDPRDRVQGNELAELSRGVDRLGPDGGRDHVGGSVGMAYRAFHTTPESRLENQPLVRRDCVLTWDGRLDNRHEVRSELRAGFDENPTDADLVLAAYLEWGTGCFKELIGDWALALWDQARQRLILARDSMGVRRLFYRLERDNVAWCTAIEPLVLTSSRKLHLDLDYLAGCIYPRPPLESTACVEIRSVVPASFLTFQLGGRQSSKRYWALDPQTRIRYATDAEYEEHFREILRESIHRRLRADRPILAELSGGIDSSSIVCAADEIRRQHSGPDIETLSYFDSEEPSGDERSYFELVEKKRGRSGHHISLSEFNHRFAGDALKSLPEECFSATPGYTAKSLRLASVLEEILSATGARVILSGVGGDEVLGGVQYEAPELADHLLRGRLFPFCRAAFQWGLTRDKTFYSLLADALALIFASYRPESLLANSGKLLPWVLLKPPKHRSAVRGFSDWRSFPPVSLLMESVRFVLAQQLTCTDPPLIGCAEKRYPYLDRQLFVYLASIPRTQILRPSRRRHLMRRALCGLVPEEVLFRKTKWFGVRNPAAVLMSDPEGLEAVFKDPWLTDGVVVDVGHLRTRLKAVEHGASSEAIALSSAIGIELWMRDQVRLGILAFEPRVGDGLAALDQTAPLS